MHCDGVNARRVNVYVGAGGRALSELGHLGSAQELLSIKDDVGKGAAAYIRPLFIQNQKT